MQPNLFLQEVIGLAILLVFIKSVSAEFEYNSKTYIRNELMMRNNLTQSLVHLLRSHKGVKEFRIEDGRFKVNTVQRSRIRNRSNVSHPPIIETNTEQTMPFYDEPDFRTDDYSSQESSDRLYTKRSASHDQYYDTRIFTMNDTIQPLETKQFQVFSNLKPDTETGNNIYHSVLSVHNTSDLQITTEASPYSVLPLSDQVYKRYFKDISQRQLKNIRDMTYIKQDVESPNTNIYKLLKIETVTKDPYSGQTSLLKKNESLIGMLRQPSYIHNENKAFSVRVNKKNLNNESDSNANETYFVSYLNDIIPVIEQQIKNGVMNFIEQNNSKKFKVDDERHSEKIINEKTELENYKTKSKDDIHYTLVKTLNDVYKQYEDVRKIYNVILKIHFEILNVKNELNSKLTSIISNESSIAEKYNILSKLEKELILKQEAFMTKQNEFYKIQKGFSEKQREFHATQLKIVKNDQMILQRQKELSSQQSEIAKKQEFLTNYLKHYISKLRSIHHLENGEVPTFINHPNVPKVNLKSKPEYKVTPLHPVTADKIQQIIKSNLDNSDNPTAFLIKIKNRAADSRLINSEFNDKYIERTDETDEKQKDIDDLVYEFYFKNSSINKIMIPHKEYQSERIYNLLPENTIKRIKHDYYPIIQEDLSKKEDLAKQFKKDRKKRFSECSESGMKSILGRFKENKNHENIEKQILFPMGKPKTIELVQKGKLFPLTVKKISNENKIEDPNIPKTARVQSLKIGVTSVNDSSIALKQRNC